MCVKAWHHLGIRLTSQMSSGPPPARPPVSTRWLRSFPQFLTQYKKSTSRERVFTLVGRGGQLWGRRGEERWGCWHYVTSQWHLSDTCAHILTNEWQSDQNIWAIKTENNIHRPLDWSHWLPSLTQLGWTRNTSPSLRSNIAGCLLDANIILILNS